MKRRTFAGLLSLVVLLSLVQYGMTTAWLGESESSYGVLDDSVRPFLVARLPLSGVSVDEWAAAVTDPAHTKYGRVHRRRTHRKSRGGPPPLWLQTGISSILLTFLLIRTLPTATVLNVRINVQITTLCARVVFALLRARTPLPVTFMCARMLLTVLCAPARSQVRRVYHLLHRCLQAVVVVSSGYSALVIEMLLMLSGNVERNPGPVVHLCPGDLFAVLTELYEVCAEWENIGLGLGLTSGILDSMKGSNKPHKDCLRDMLKEWLNTSPDPCWQSLIQALRSPIVGKEPLARHLEGKFCTQGGSVPHPATVQTDEAVQRQTADQIEELKKEFESLVKLAHVAVVRKQLDPSDFHEMLTRLEATYQVQAKHRNTIINDYLCGLPENYTVKNIWTKLITYWDFFNYGLLERVIFQFGDKDLQQKMKKYVDKFDSFKKTTSLRDFVRNCPRLDHIPSRGTLKELKVKMDHPDWSHCTLWEVEEFKMILIRKHRISKKVLVVFKEEEDGISISWLIPPTLESKVESNLRKTPCQFFKMNRIAVIILDGHQYYNAKLEPFADYLRGMYEDQVPDFFVRQWPPPPTRKVFNLAMIHSDETIRRQPPREEHVGLMLRGDVSGVMRKKSSVRLENLFKLYNSRRKVILIEGAPGAGKSTLAWHICQKWKARELFQEFMIVIYVQLRDPDIQSATSVVELLPTYPGIKREDLAAEIESCFGTRVLFVLDGWDEYRPGLQVDSLFDKLIRNPQKLYLQRRTLLITSRPVASRELQSYATYRVEILGFTPGEVRQYFEEALGDPQTVQNLQDQLRERPVIEASCYLPLNAAIVAHLFKELNYTLPTTLHGVFSTVVCGCIRRHLKKQSGKEIEIPSFDELPSSVQEDFQSMCTLAYKGSMVNKVTFSGQDFKSYGLSTQLNVLDLMQVVQSFASQKSTLYHFLHLSVQELLTARNISKLSETEQIQIFNRIFDTPRFAAVFRFYAAFTKLQVEGIRGVVAHIAQSGQRDRLLNLVHCVYEAQDISLSCFVASQLNGKLDLGWIPLSPLDCLSVGYFLSCVCQSTSGEFRVDLHSCSLDDYSVRFLAKELSKCDCASPDSSQHNPLPGKLVLDLSYNRLHGDGVSEMISHFSVISKLDLSGQFRYEKGEDSFKHLLQALKTNTSVVELNLSGNRNLIITEDSGPVLVEMLMENRTLRKLDLSGNDKITDRGLQFLGEGLKKNTGLKTLKLKNLMTLDSLEQVTVGDWKQFVLCLKENDHLTELFVFQMNGQMNSSVVCQEAAAVNKARQQKYLPPLTITLDLYHSLGERLV